MDQLDPSAWPEPLLPAWGLKYLGIYPGYVQCALIDLQTFDRISPTMEYGFAFSGATLDFEQMTEAVAINYTPDLVLSFGFASVEPAPGMVFRVDQWAAMLHGRQGEWFPPQKFTLR